MILIKNLEIDINATDSAIENLICRTLNVSPDDIDDVKLHKLSIDARHKNKIKKIASFYVKCKCELKRLPKNCENADVTEYKIKVVNDKVTEPVIVVGSGPCGLFCAYALNKARIPVTLIERGSEINKRVDKVNTFYKTRVLDESTNIQFGEGGAGTFSDGKLTTGIKSEKCAFIKKVFYDYGAPEDVLYASMAHIGTDYLRKIVYNMRMSMSDMTTVLFDTVVKDVITDNGAVKGVVVNNADGERVINASNVVFCIGHSARDTYSMLMERGVAMRPKPFSIGVRVEHGKQSVDYAQYGNIGLSEATYKLATHLKNGRGVYTFCMCPGGEIVAAASEKGGVVVNGMSNFARDGVNSNSAVLVSVMPEDFGNDIKNGIEFQRKYERMAFSLAGGDYSAPAQLVGDFLKNIKSTNFGNVKPTYPLGVTLCNLTECLPEFAVESIRAAIPEFANKVKGFADYDGIFTGVETRSSSPVQIIRNDLSESSISGLYCAGEGAGYAGGIMSAAVDGINVAERIIEKINGLNKSNIKIN